MFYVMSDLHGRYDKYTEMIDKIALKDSDSLFINGDICDRGPEPMKIMKDALMRCNVFPIIGDCDYRALRMLSSMEGEKARKDSAYMKSFAAWLKDGGMPTVTEFRGLSDEEKSDILDYIREEFVAYDEITTSEGDYLLVHAGLPGFAEGMNPDDYSVKDIISCPADFSREYFSDKILITGHTPTFKIDENSRNMIYRRNGQIGIDCGLAEGGTLGCLCLDNGKEFYV